ncbi:MAG: hypothetical protein ACE5LS_07860 [Thermoplasmata archaeon]
MLPRTTLALPILLTLGLALLALPAPVSAHEHIEVGDLEFIVGWRAEPPVVGVLNGLDLGISRHPSEEPVMGAEGNLTATLRTGPTSVTKSIRPQFGRDGWYTFDVVPTREGDYTVQIEGTLEGTAVDITVALKTVLGRAGVEFPVNDPSASELQDAILASADETAALRAQVGTLSIIAAVGIIIGAVGVAVASLALWRMRS